MRRVLPFLRFSLVIFLLTALACPAFSEDIQTLIKDAEGGNPKAQFNLGLAYGNGQGVMKHRPCPRFPPQPEGYNSQ